MSQHTGAAVGSGRGVAAVAARVTLGGTAARTGPSLRGIIAAVLTPVLTRCRLGPPPAPRRWLAPSTVLALALGTGGALAAGPSRPALGPSAPQVALSEESLRRHVAVLGSDAMEGRGTGTPGGARAAAYIAAALAGAGLHPAGDAGGFLQQVHIHGSAPLPECDLMVVTPCDCRHLRLGDDYLLRTCGASTLIPAPVPVVFVGYGIVAPEFDYNDYLGVDVRGKVVAYLTGEPPSTHRDFFAGPLPTVHSRLETKRRTAMSRGARGCLVLPSPQTPRWQDWGWARAQLEGEQVTLAYTVPGHLEAVLRPEAAAALFCGAPAAAEDVLARASTHTMRSVPLAASLSFRGRFAERDFLAPNVVGVLRGADPDLAATAVLVSAHHDHLGVGPAVRGDRIYNGVVDNALGVAAVIEIARVMAASPPPARSVVFLLTTGEESGLLGAAYHAEHPAVPAASTVANLNIDGLAFLDTFDDVFGIGAELSTLGTTLQEVAASQGLTVSPLPSAVATLDAYARSDQQAFAEAGIPSVLVVEGLSWRHHGPDEALARTLWWGEHIYHSPQDDLAQPLSWAAALQHATLLLALVRELASDAPAPQWRPGSPYAHTRLLSLRRRR